MDFKQYFLYQTDYQHWANEVLFNALDRLSDEARRSPQKLYFGSIHDSVDHLAFFYRKWFARLNGERSSAGYSAPAQPDWRELKSDMRQTLREMQRWMERQPDDFLDRRLHYVRTLSHEEKGVWMRDALTHLFTYATLERGHVSAIGSTLGAPFLDMAYYTYRLEMGEHLDNMRKPGDQAGH